jgi:hypothetical protein
MIAPGVPIVRLQDMPPDPDAMTADTVSTPSGSDAPQWGLYKDNTAIITANSIAVFGFKAPSEISDYPVENGGFASYNKVQLPFSGRVRYVTGGSLADRINFLNSVDAAKKSLDLYDLVTPEETYRNVNVTDYDYERRADNAGLLIVDLVCEEVRVTGTVTYSTAPGVKPITKARPLSHSNDPQNDGTLQTTPASSQQVNAYNSTIQTGPASTSLDKLAGH